ncbi:MAG: hypothetical protein Q9M92_10565 [Enterobacterales bacterium]|nr:hypothetical protein [Enterobacterales bacterium]
MSDFSEIAKFVAADFRYGITVLSSFILGLLLLFLPELGQFTKQIVVPALVVYTIGSALIGHIQILLTVSANTKAKAGEERGIREGHLNWIIWSHISWLLMYIGFQDGVLVPNKKFKRDISFAAAPQLGR